MRTQQLNRQIRTTESTEETHLDHIAARGHVSMPHYGMVQKPLSILKALESPAAKVAMDRGWRKGRMTHLFLCGLMMTNATILLVDRRQPQPKPSQITHDSSAATTLNLQHSPHISESAFHFQNVQHQRRSRLFFRARLE